jgi:putative transposase
MPRGKPNQADQIILKLRAAELELALGKTITEAAKKIGVAEQTYYRWKKKYSGLRIDHTKRFNAVRKEIAAPKPTEPEPGHSLADRFPAIVTPPRFLYQCL